MNDSASDDWVKAVPGGIRLSLKVHPKAHANCCAGVRNGALLIRVTAPPDKGKANNSVLKLLAKQLKIPRGSLRLVSGAAARTKVVEVSGVSADQARRLLV